MPKKILPPPPEASYVPEEEVQNVQEIDLNELDAAIKNEEKYGGRPVEAAVRAGLSAATMGASDVVEKAITEDPERMREVQEANPGAATAGTAVGIVGPALATLGTSAAAQTASAGVRAVNAVGLAAEKAAAAALAPRIGPGVASTVAKGVGGAVEGAVVGAGQLASEIAKEKVELSAESLAAHVGTGALVGGGFGMTLGAGQATLPKLKSLGRSSAKKVGGVVESGLEGIIDPVEASLSLVSANATENLSLRRALGESNLKKLPAYVKDDLALEVTTTPRQRYNRNSIIAKESGEQIGAITKQLDDLIEAGQVPVSRAEAYQPLINRLNSKLVDFGEDVVRANGAEVRLINRLKNEAIEAGISEKPFSFSDYDKLRRYYQEISYGAVGQKEGFRAKIADELRAEARDVIDNLASKATEVSPNLAEGLKAANHRYSMAATLEPKLKKLISQQPTILQPIKFAHDTTARLARNTAVVNDIAAKVANLKTTVSSSVDKFFKPVAVLKSLPSTLASTQILTSSLLSRDLETDRAPKNKVEAFKNLQENVSSVSNDSDKLIELLAKKTARVAAADPAIAGALQSTLTRSIQFLDSKIPRSSVQPGMFSRPYQPTSMEMAKLERYMQIIEKPLTALQELEQGTLTREHVEALKAVYPSIYQEIQMVVTDRIAENPNLPYAKKVQLSILLDVPADSSLSGESVMQLQQSISGTTEEPQNPQAAGDNSTASTTMTGLKGIDVAGREASGVQKLQADVP